MTRRSSTPGILDRDRLQFGLPPISADQRTLAERHWQAPTKAPKPQQPCDHGLFSDEADQLDLVEMLQPPIEED